VISVTVKYLNIDKNPTEKIAYRSKFKTYVKLNTLYDCTSIFISDNGTK